MMNKKLTLTIVIPVYNEEHYLKACLDSIAAQTIMPDEVLVIDNNSTDSSIDIARKYKFVKVLHERRQHQVFAQAIGFNAAKSDILGRIDGDTVLTTDWVARVKKAFSENDDVVGVTGGADPYDAPMAWIGIAIFNWYTYMVRLIIGHRILWGANCAIRSSGWQKVKGKVLMRADIWEDYDLAFCLSEYGRIKYIYGLRAGVSLRSMHTTFIRHVRYQFRSVRTFYFRANPIQMVLFIFLWSTTFIVYPLAFLDDWLLKNKKRA
jgi:glycosyltransferase involved in cell wall biosynthesis